MPVSASQHRVSAGAYQNKLHDNFRVNSTTQTQGINPDRSGIPDEIHHSGSRISRVVNSHEELSRPSYQTTSPRQGIAAPLLMLLSQVRLDGIPISPTTDIPAFTSERSMFPSVSRNAPHSDNSGNGFSAMLSPVANALYETGQYIARHDPLRFPVADASPVQLAETSTTVASAARNLKSDSYIVEGEQKKNELISSLVRYLVSDGQLTADESEDVERWLRSEAAGMPMVAARLDNEEVDTSRKKRALVAENDPRTAEHIKEHCAFEEEVLDAQGENQGKVLIFQAQRAENPFRMIYDNNPDGRPSPEERGVADGLNISADILTLGIKPLIGKLIANAKRREYYLNQGDEICAERFRRLFIAELATSLDVDGLTFTRRGSAGKVKPSELLHALPERERAAFYTRNPHTGIRKEILLELKQGKGAINDNGSKVYLKPTEKTNEFVTYHPDAVKPELLERRVIVDESNLSWRYADSFDSLGLNVEISEGKKQIRLHGENYAIHQNGAGKYEIVVNKPSGIKEFVPVYMEPLSRTWHLSTHNEHSVFSNKQIDIIKDIKVNKEDGFFYIPRGNNNQNYYGGNGNIYVQEKMGDSGHYPWGRYVEMNGELVPVKEMVTPGHGVHYEVYDLKFPEKAGHPIEWDGNRWLFERKTSVHVSKDLKNLISPEMVSEKVDAGKLSVPDHQGLRYDVDGNKYIKIKNEYIKLEQRKDLPFIRMNNGDKIYVSYAGNKFKSTKVNRHNDLVSSGSDEVLKDSRINSLSGLDVLEIRHLNEAWSLKGVNIKNKNFNKDDAIGSTIDVTFTMEYNKLKNNRYIEMPPLQWKEKIDFKEGDSKWQFQTDMYEHNPTSRTFSSWLNRYVEAYNFAKSKDKGLFNGNVRIYKKNMEPVGVNDIRSAGTPIEKVKNIQDFLSRNGGVIEITITDSPQILKREIAENKERKLTFDIGFKGKAEVHFNQGIRLVNDGENNVFVTTSDNIKLARGDVNVQPPERVTKPRDHHFLHGEVY
ncbi:hypothetical protein [Hafnia paralvei]|uniref:hypothetical protein n=1 Tax=Hafnia paralvei TaxID=546367 RepID=UPI00300D8CD8